MNREACLKLISEFLEPDPDRTFAEAGVMRLKHGFALSLSVPGVSVGLFDDNQINVADPDFLIIRFAEADYPTIHKVLWSGIYGVSIQLLGLCDKEAVGAALISRKM